jgi:hypothetical protein
MALGGRTAVQREMGLKGTMLQRAVNELWLIVLGVC